MIRNQIRTMILKGIIRLYKNGDAADSDMHRILVVRLDEIGDMVLMSPFLRELRRNHPDAEITLIVKPTVYNLVELCPYVDYIKVFHAPYPGRGRFFRLMLAASKFVRSELTGSYDLAIVPRFDADASYGAGFIAFFSKARRRLGYENAVTSVKSISDCGFDDLYTDLIPARKGAVHEVERNMDVLRYLGYTIIDTGLELWINDEDNNIANYLLGKYSDRKF